MNINRYYFEDKNGYIYGPYLALSESVAIQRFSEDVGGDFKLDLEQWSITKEEPAQLERKSAASVLGSSKSPAKVEAARINGAKGGRPKKI